MTYSDNVTFFGGKGWADVRGDILVALFITTVFRNVMKVVSSDDNSSLHFRGDTNTFQNTPTNRDIASERAFFVNIISFDSSFRSFKPKAASILVSPRRTATRVATAKPPPRPTTKVNMVVNNTENSR